MIKKIETKNAPAAIGPYSQATKAGQFVFVSGQIPIDPETGCIVSNKIGDQAVQVFKNVEAVLLAAGTDIQHTVKTTVFLKDLGNFAEVNEVYKGFFDGKVLPARSAIEVARLPKDVLIETEVIAVVD